MRPNVKMIDKSKNSFIYFQLGLIAVMVAVLFVLELNFKTENFKDTSSFRIELPDDEPFRFVGVIEKAKSEPRKQVVTKPIVKPVIQPKIINQFVETKEEVKDDLIKETAHQDSNIPVSTVVDNSNINPVDSNSGNGGSKDEVFVVVEFLPRFPNCLNVSKDNQKACFDEQLQKAIFKTLVYPEKDLKNEKEGTVFVQFIVDEKGNFTSIKIPENNRATDDMRQAVEKAVKKLPRIIPARQGEKDVKVTYTIPISFKINK
jgi:TonB family protein